MMYHVLMHLFIMNMHAINMPEGLREDPYHWTELPSLNKDYYYHYHYYYYYHNLK